MHNAQKNAHLKNILMPVCYRDHMLKAKRRHNQEFEHTHTELLHKRRKLEMMGERYDYEPNFKIQQEGYSSGGAGSKKSGIE